MNEIQQGRGCEVGKIRSSQILSLLALKKMILPESLLWTASKCVVAMPVGRLSHPKAVKADAGAHSTLHASEGAKGQYGPMLPLVNTNPSCKVCCLGWWRNLCWSLIGRGIQKDHKISYGSIERHDFGPQPVWIWIWRGILKWKDDHAAGHCMAPPQVYGPIPGIDIGGSQSGHRVVSKCFDSEFLWFPIPNMPCPVKLGLKQYRP